MKVVTLRGIPVELARILQRKSREEGKSLNRVVIDLLLEACGIRKSSSAPKVNHDFDEFFGVWSRKEADDFDAALSDQRRVDPEIWK